MFNRRTLLMSLAALPVPVAGALAQPYWDERARHAEWERFREDERRRHEGRREAWDDRRQHEMWQARRREEARLEWEREHGPRRR